MADRERPIRRAGGVAGRRAAQQFKRLAMTRTKLQNEGPQPRQIRRADLAPATGYAIIVDGRFKTEFAEENVAKTAATELLANYPMLKVEIYDASSKSRTTVA
jgi:hypothetical protein